MGFNSGVKGLNVLCIEIHIAGAATSQTGMHNVKSNHLLSVQPDHTP